MDPLPQIHTLASLRTHLQLALMVEHFTIPPYLTALYSIKDGANPEAAAIIKSVAMEEMLHMTLVANLLNAVGGSPSVNDPRFVPSYPDYLPHSQDAFLVALAPFSKEAIHTFMQIEKPEVRRAPPEAHRFETIGQFYHAVQLGLEWLCETEGEQNVFTGDPGRQIQPSTYYYGGHGAVMAVHDLETARAALDEIVEQGEGADFTIYEEDLRVEDGETHEDEVAHYFRFLEVYEERRFQPGDTPATGPTGAPLPVDWAAVHAMRPNPRAADYPMGSMQRTALDDFNRAYGQMLDLLHEAFNGAPHRLQDATGQMYRLRHHATALLNIPSGDGETVLGPSFEHVPADQAVPD